MDALEFYKSHESAPLPDIGDLVSLTVEEICELMEQYHQSKVNNSVLGDVSKPLAPKEVKSCMKADLKCGEVCKEHCGASWC